MCVRCVARHVLMVWADWRGVRYLFQTPTPARGAGQSHRRGQLQPATPGWTGARQRLDYPGAGRSVRRCRLARDQAAVGLGLGPAVRPRRPESALGPGQLGGRHAGRAGLASLPGDAGIAIYPTPEEAVWSCLQLVKYHRNQALLMETPSSIPKAFTPDVTAARRIITIALAAARKARPSMTSPTPCRP